MRRIILSIISTIMAFSLLLILLNVQAMDNSPLTTPTTVPPPTEAPPTSTPEYPVFSATMSIIPSQNQVAISDTLVVTISIDVSEGCSFSVYELNLTQSGADGGIFTYTSPSTPLVIAPRNSPYSYTLTAITTGTVVFSGSAYGERNCGDGFVWTYVNGESTLVRVGEWPYQLHLPIVQKP